MGYATGEAKEFPLRPVFDRRIKLDFHGARITSDGGLLAYRELDHALGLTDMAIRKLLDERRGRNTRHKLIGLFRQSVLGRPAGYEDVNDAERLARDPVMRAIVGREGLDRAAASSSQMGRFETEWWFCQIWHQNGFVSRWHDMINDISPQQLREEESMVVDRARIERLEKELEEARRELLKEDESGTG